MRREPRRDGDDIILSGGPLSGYRVRQEWTPFNIGPVPPLFFPVHDGPRVATAVYVPSGRVRAEFVRDTPIYSYQAPR